MSKNKLKNAPLKEVIFELHWESTLDDNGNPYDPGYNLAQGKFADRVNSEFPVYKKLILDEMPFNVFGAAMHQYWKGEFTWPVIQHGQGILAVNEVEYGYEWANGYKPLLIKSINDLQASYEDKLSFNVVKLQYIDAWDLNGMDPSEFIAKNLQTEIHNNYDLSGKARSFNIEQNFELNDDTLMSLKISTGINNINQQPSVIWTTTVEKKSKMIIEDVTFWLESAQRTTSMMFFLIKEKI
jgi:uncharacterized protein (TIGR04255 family)